MLFEKKFNAGQLKLIEILSNPENAGMSEDQIAEECGVARATVWRWKKDTELWDTVYKIAYDNLNREIPKVYHALSQRAVAGNTKAIELYLKFIGKYIERTETKIEADVDFSSMSDKELKKAIEEAERLTSLVE